MLYDTCMLLYVSCVHGCVKDVMARRRVSARPHAVMMPSGCARACEMDMVLLSEHTSGINDGCVGSSHKQTGERECVCVCGSG